MTDQPNAQPASNPAPSDGGGFSVPEQYATTSWAQNIKSSDDLWAQMSNAQTLIGKRPAGIPTADAPPEEWDKFYTAMGRPESADKYGLPDVEGVPEGFDLSPYQQKMRELAHKVGLSPKQAEKAWQEYMGMELTALTEQQKAQAERQEAQDKEYNELVGRLFGDQYDSFAKDAQDFIANSVPQELRESVVQGMADGSIDNKTLVAMISMAKHAKEQIAAVKKQYGAEDNLSSKGTPAAGQSVDEIRKALVEAKTEVAKHQLFTPARREAESRMESLRADLARMVNR